MRDKEERRGEGVREEGRRGEFIGAELTGVSGERAFYFHQRRAIILSLESFF